MQFSAKNGRTGDTDYVRFGSGERVLIMLPGLGDGLRTVKGTALPMAMMYRKLAKDFTIYMFSRKNDLPEGHTALMESNVRRIYSESYYRKNKWLIPIMGKLTKPKSYRRFLVQAQACLTHDAWEDLPKISAPTFVIGGEQDRCLGGDASRELAARIPNAKLHMYPQWGHGLYEEAKDFMGLVLSFLR